MSHTLSAQVNIRKLWSAPLNSYREPPSSSDPVRQSHTVRLLRWDDAHVLIYWIAKQPELLKRQLSENSGWVMNISLLSLTDGKSERTYTLPAQTRFAELAVLPDTVILSDGGRLRFFTREFAESKAPFFYKQLHAPVEMGRAGPVGDVERLHIAPDANHFALMDSYGETSQFFVFEVPGHILNDHWIVSGVDPASVSMGARSILARSFYKTDSVSRLSFGGDKTEITVSSQHTQTCVTPISLDDDSFLNVCHTVSLISPDRMVELIHLSEDERIDEPSSLSRNRRSLATIKTTVRPSGWLDRTEKATKAALLVTELRNSPRSVEVAIPVKPQRDISLTFASDTTIVIADGEQITAFSLVGNF